MARVSDSLTGLSCRILSNISRKNHRLGDVINRFRSSIDLAPVPRTEGPCLAEALEIPMTYCWSPALVPRPTDWPAHIGQFSKFK